MFFLPAMNSLARWFKSGVFSGAGRGGPGRLLVIAGVGVAMAAVLVLAAMTSQKPNMEFRVRQDEGDESSPRRAAEHASAGCFAGASFAGGSREGRGEERRLYAANAGKRSFEKPGAEGDRRRSSTARQGRGPWRAYSASAAAGLCRA